MINWCNVYTLYHIISVEDTLLGCGWWCDREVDYDNMPYYIFITRKTNQDSASSLTYTSHVKGGNPLPKLNHLTLLYDGLYLYNHR